MVLILINNNLFLSLQYGIRASIILATVHHPLTTSQLVRTKIKRKRKEERSPCPPSSLPPHSPRSPPTHDQSHHPSLLLSLPVTLFSVESVALYPMVVLKTRLHVSHPPPSACTAAATILRHEGLLAFYRGFTTSLTSTIPARTLYMTALEVTKSVVSSAALRLGFPEPAASTAAGAAAGLSAAIAAQVVWTPVDVISQRLMVQRCHLQGSKYLGGLDAFRKILSCDGVRGLYRGFGMSILTYAPSNAMWWASYSLSQRIIWGGLGYYYLSRQEEKGSDDGSGGMMRPGYGAVVVVQGVSAAMAGGAAAVVTMPLDTIKTRMQVMEGRMTIGRTVRSLMREGGWGACYRGLGPRWASMSVSATTMITTYEFLKRLSAKRQEGLAT